MSHFEKISPLPIMSFVTWKLTFTEEWIELVILDGIEYVVQ